MLELNGFYNMDCIDGMKLIDDKSINLIHTDPPYNIGIAEWDKIPDYVEWCGKWIKECERVLKDNGSFYFWHNDMSQIPQLMEWIRQNTAFVFNSFIIWDKGEFRAQSWKNPMPDNNLRSWFNTCEYCLFYTFQSIDGGAKEVNRESGYFNKCVYSVREYLRAAIIKKDGKISLKKINNMIGTADNGGGVASAVLSLEKKQPAMITKEHYELLRREYEDLRREYEDLRFTHNLDKNHNNVWRFNSPQDRIHICEKPQEIVQRIVKCSSNKNDIVLDLFAGSASTAIASYILNRNYICFEKDSTIFNKATARLEAVKSQISIFNEPEPTEQWEQAKFI